MKWIGCFCSLIVIMSFAAFSDDITIVQTIVEKCGMEGVGASDVVTEENGRVVTLDLKNREISQDGISFIPAEIGQLTALKVLIASGNIIDSIPSEIGQLTELTKLDLASNRIVAIPPTIGNCINLTHLDMRYNRLTVLPPEIGNCKKLFLLQLWGNKLTEVTDAITKLPVLEEIYLKDNRLTTLPVGITRMKINYIDIIGNKMCDLSPKLDAWFKKKDKRYRETQKCW
jgi:Leucine-rich repeat (LRR) protein